MTIFRRFCVLISALLCCAGGVHAEFLMQQYLEPSFSTETDWWDVFYSPYNGANKPDFFSTHGSRTTASFAGATPPANSNPANPIAYWSSNATITQTLDPNAFIIGPGSTGNIYSFSAATGFVLNDTKSTPLTTAIFQFQTSGTEVDFFSIKLVYVNGSGQTVMLSASGQQYLREYRAGTSTFGGYDSRVAIQWNLTGLNITSYQIVWQAQGSSMSFQEAILDTASTTYTAVVPSARTWIASGAGTWSTGAMWQEGSTTVANGNVKFNNSGAATISLDGSRTVGEMIFNNANNVTVNSSAGSQFTANTGITTNAAATGTYTINAGYAMGAFNIFHIAAGTVQLNGVVSGAYGFVKEGDGTLILSQNNTFTGSSGVGVAGGVLKLLGANVYTGATSIQNGTLIVGANAGSTGALGSASTNIELGADSDIFQFAGAGTAQLLIEGNFSISRNVTFSNGTYEKHIGVLNATTGATYSGTIDFSTSTNAHLTAQNVSDRVVFSGAMTGGAAVFVDGLGTVEYSGTAKTYTGSTTVQSGTLRIAAGNTFDANGNYTVNSGASLLVNGSLGGTGTLTVLGGGKLGGTGTVSRLTSIGGGAILTPGEGIGTMSFINTLTLGGGGEFLWEINNATGSAGMNWDRVNIAGSLAITATSGNPYVIQASTLAGSIAGAMSNFDPQSLYDWTLITASGGITGFSAADFTFDFGSFSNSHPGAFSVLMSGNSLVVHYEAVPEPSRALLLMGGLVSIFWRRRRRSFASTVSKTCSL